MNIPGSFVLVQDTRESLFIIKDISSHTVVVLWDVDIGTKVDLLVLTTNRFCLNQVKAAWRHNDIFACASASVLPEEIRPVSSA